MRRRRQTNSGATFLGLDSFLDIVTNVIGAFFFVVIYAVLSAAGATGKITLPLASVPETSRVLAECRDETVFFIEADRLIERSNEVWKEADGLPFDERVDRLAEAGISSRYYTYEPRLARFGWYRRVVDTLVPLPGAVGERERELASEWSLFRRRLASYDPESHHIIFLVRTDSFEVFHAARRLAISMGFSVGWEPILAGEPLRFSAAGRSLTVY